MMKTALVLLSLCVCTATVLVLAADAPPPPPCWHPLINATLRAAKNKNPLVDPPIMSVNDSLSIFASLHREKDGTTITLDWNAEISLTSLIYEKSLLTSELSMLRQAAPVLLQCAAGTLNQIQQQGTEEIKQLSDCAQLVVASFGRNVIGRSEMRDFVALIERVLSAPPPAATPTTPAPTIPPVVGPVPCTGGPNVPPGCIGGPVPCTGGPGIPPGCIGGVPVPCTGGPNVPPGCIPTGAATINANADANSNHDANLEEIANYFIRLFGNVNFNETGTIITVDAEARIHFIQRAKLCDVLMKPSVPAEYGDCVRRMIDASRVLVGTNVTMQSALNQLKVAFDSDVESRQRSGLQFNLTASIIVALTTVLPTFTQSWIDQTLACIHQSEQPIPQPPAQSGIPGGADRDDSDPICEIMCPNNLICVGRLCVPPRPKCDGCTPSPTPGSDRFCFISVNVTLLSRFNAYAYAATVASRRGSTYQRPLDTEFEFTYGVDITARGDYRGVCVRQPPTPQCLNVTNPVPCSPGDICTKEGCRRCDLCAGNGRPGDNSSRIPDDVSDALVRGGLDLSGFVRVDDRVNNTREGRDVEAVQGGFQQIGPEVRNLIGLLFQAGQGGANSSQQTAVQLARGSQLHIQQIIQSIPSAPVAVVVDGNASFNANRIELRQDTTFSILLGGRDSQGRCNGNASLNGALTIQGSSDTSDNDTTTTSASGQLQAGGSWNFPPRRQDVNAGPNAVINVAGAVALAGDISNATLNVIAIATARAVCIIANGARFATAGRILGDSGLIYVRGAFVVQTTLVQPQLIIENGGNVTLDAGDTRTGFLGGSLNISANGQLNLRSNGTETNFTTFAECAATATLVVTVDSLVTVRRPGARGVLFRFSSIGTLGIRYACRIRLIDAQNNTLDLINRNQPANSRRLLADGQTEAVFTGNEVAFQTANDTSGGTTTPPTAGGTTAPPNNNGGTTAPPNNNGGSSPTTNTTTTTSPPTNTGGTTTNPPTLSSSTGDGKSPNMAYTTTQTSTHITAVGAAITAILIAAF